MTAGIKNWLLVSPDESLQGVFLLFFAAADACSDRFSHCALYT